MNHEPECPTGIDWYEMCECESLRSAYQRGREDAATAVEAAPYMTNVVPSGWTDETWRGYRPDAIDRETAIAAARGDGEQE